MRRWWQRLGREDKRRLHFCPGQNFIKKWKWDLLLLTHLGKLLPPPKRLGIFALQLVVSDGFTESWNSYWTSRLSSEAGAQQSPAELGLLSVASWGARRPPRRWHWCQTPQPQGWSASSPTAALGPKAERWFPANGQGGKAFRTWTASIWHKYRALHWRIEALTLLRGS